MPAEKMEKAQMRANVTKYRIPTSLESVVCKLNPSLAPGKFVR